MQNHARREGRLYRSLQELAALGVGPEHAGGLIGKHGAGAAQFFRENPYAAIEQQVPLRVIDQAARHLGLSVFDPRRAPALAYELVRLACEEEGHSCLPELLLSEQLQQEHALDAGEAQAAIETAYAAAHLKQEHGAAFLPQQHRMERWLADDLLRIHLANVEALTPQEAPHLTGEQRQAVALGCTSGLTLITGGPGTGKTTTLKVLLDSLEAAGLHTTLCAPTGKAASRMSQSTGREATTLHRLLGYNGKDFGRGMLAGEVCVVDEVSMTSNALLGALLRSVYEGSRVVLVGDEDQLPPIDPGHPLAALIKTMPLARLTQTHRQAEGSPILKLAHLLIAGEVPAHTGVPFEQAQDSRDVVQTAQRHQEVHGERPMILTAGRAGTLGVAALNTALQDAFNPGEGRLRVGDPVMMTRNDHQRGLMNGMTGQILGIGKKGVSCEFEGKPQVFASAEAGLLELAYAMTIHRSQGSEWEHVMVVLTEQHERLLSRQLAYTAVTRAKRELIASGSRSAWGQSALTGFPRRHSRLERMLRE